jgi:hypothetical protein
MSVEEIAREVVACFPKLDHDAVHLARLKNTSQYPDTLDPWEVQ